jgi:hypothetical protein
VLDPGKDVLLPLYHVEQSLFLDDVRTNAGCDRGFDLFVEPSPVGTDNVGNFLSSPELDQE